MSDTRDNHLRELAVTVVKRLQNAGFEALWVGGCVRDFLLQRTPQDFDIATNALPEQVELVFPKTIAVGRKFGVMVVVEDGRHFQVATFRAETDYEDGRRPGSVTFGDPRADALRRDFTINGLFYDPVAKQLRDWVGGEVDLRAGIIRTIGDPRDRFAEDHLRMLRAVRFAAQLGFDIDADTFSVIQDLAAKIKLISPERIRDELLRLFQPPHAARGLELIRGSGLLAHVIPELQATDACEQSPNFHPEGNVFKHLCLMLSLMPQNGDPLLAWTVLLHDIAKPLTASRDPQTGSIHFYEHEKIGAEMTRTILERLRFPRRQIEAVATAVRHHMQIKDAPRMRKATLRRVLMRPTFPLELELHRLDCLGSHGRLDVYEFLVRESAVLVNQPQIRPPLLTGDDLIKLGVKPGPAMGRLLAEIREKQLADELTTRAAATTWVKARIAQ